MQLRTKILSAVTAAAMVISIPLVERVEGVEHKPYSDLAGVWTVCAGITGKDVIPGKLYTDSECKVLLAKHMKTATDAVDNAVKVDIPPTMRAALYSFTFNAGQGAFRKSTILKRTNEGKHKEACKHLFDWVYYTDPKTKKKVKSKGLYNRRAEEYAVCVKDL